METFTALPFRSILGGRSRRYLVQYRPASRHYRAAVDAAEPGDQSPQFTNWPTDLPATVNDGTRGREPGHHYCEQVGRLGPN